MRELLRCGSWMVYSTRGRSAASMCARYVIVRLKRGRVEPRSGRSWADLLVAQFARQSPAILRQLFASPVTLVPVPACGARAVESSGMWPTFALCHELCRRGCGDDVQAVLQRVETVSNSAWVPRRRPSVEDHFHSLGVTSLVTEPRRVLLVDDVVTRGATLMAAARRLAVAYPATQVEAFALARVQGAGDVEQVIQPCLEHIKLTRTGCIRLPFATPERNLRVAAAGRERLHKLPRRTSGAR
jgi:hypothetical protein